MSHSPVHPQKKRVVITGIGAVTPLGLDAPSTWSALQEGRSGVAAITRFDASTCTTQIAAEVKGFDVTAALPAPLHPVPGGEPITQAMNGKESRRFGRFAHLGVKAALEAYADSGLDTVRATLNPKRVGINIGVGMGGLPEIEETYHDFMQKGFKRISPYFIPQTIPNMVGGQVSILLHFQGPNLCTVTACASSAHAIGESMRLIQRGEADVMIAGGAESTVSPLGVGGFAAMRALSTRNDAPEKASRPFDRDRDGFVLGEGAAILVLEELEHARARRAKIYAELVGYGASGDAYHMTSPAPEGEGGQRAMELALADAGIERTQVGYVNAHGTSTPAGDVEEARAIRRVFSTSSTDQIVVSSTKSMTGHLLGAAGGLEGMVCALVVRDGVIPPTINLEHLDPGCLELGMDFCAHQAQKRPQLKYALSNSFGFGGTNACLIFGKL